MKIGANDICTHIARGSDAEHDSKGGFKVSAREGEAQSFRCRLSQSRREPVGATKMKETESRGCVDRFFQGLYRSIKVEHVSCEDQGRYEAL
jgi:hypothetical protein